MLGLLLVLAFAVFVIWREYKIVETPTNLPERLSSKLNQLWDIAQVSIKDRKYLRAEKALLTILRVDEKNASAYNRLGILYAKQRAFADAIECFEIAQSLDPNASSLHNVGLIYYETEQYDKAALAFEQAISMEDNLAARHIAYAKVQEKLGNMEKMVKSLEKAAEIEPSVQSYHILADAYGQVGDNERSEALRKKIERAVESKNPPSRQIKKAKRIVM